MTISFFSNFLNHHQLPLCQELIHLIGEDNFHFISCEPIEDERSKMGYENMNIIYPFVVRAYESSDLFDYALQLAHTSDVAIIGSATGIFAKIRSENNKLTFLFSERIFKNGAWHRFIPTTANAIYNGYTRYRKRNFYVLCSSAYTADDLSKCFFPREKCLKWGYFPVLSKRINKNFDKLRILWCGRMLWWKHPEDAVETARLLSSLSIDYEMTIIGNGERRKTLEQSIIAYNLSSRILMRDFMSPSDIRSHMNDSNVYLFTSGKQEGWGAVLNEAMNSGCAVIANKNAGSTPYLIHNNKNGILYDGTQRSLQNAVSKLVSSNLSEISEAAYYTIEKIWNAKTAASRLVHTCYTLMNGQESFYNDGPCSLA